MSRSVAIAVIAILVLAGCDEPAPSSQGIAQPATAPAAAADVQEHAGFGTVNSVDRAAGSVNISHAAVASAGWPAMTMDFKLEGAAMAAELEPGQRIEFRFTTKDGGTVTAVEPLP